MKIYTFDIARNNCIPFSFKKNDRSEKDSTIFFFFFLSDILSTVLKFPYNPVVQCGKKSLPDFLTSPFYHFRLSGIYKCYLWMFSDVSNSPKIL